MSEYKNGGELKSAIIRFLRTSGAGIIALTIAYFGNFNTPEALATVAVLVAIDKYFRAKGWYDTALRSVGIKS